MKRKIIFSTIAVALLLLMLYSCKDAFLDALPIGSANNVLLANEKGVNSLLIGAYAAIDGQINGQDGASWSSSVTNWVWGDVASDDGTKGSDITDQPTINPIENYTADPSNGYIADKWRFNYAGVARCNDVLSVMAQCKPALSDEVQASIRAQVSFIRAFIHFELKRTFNNIPYIVETDEPVKVINDGAVAWTKMEDDLKYAVVNLPVMQSEVGRPTKYAAEALLAKVYIFQQKWNDAKPLLDDIINSGNYSLMPNYGDNYLASKRNNAESIFEIEYSVNDGPAGSPNAGWGDALNFPMDFDGRGTCCGFHVPTQNLVNAFAVDVAGLPFLDTAPPNFKNDMGILSATVFVQDTTTLLDPRLDFTLGRRGVPYLDWGVMRGKAWIRDQSNAGPYLNKKNMFLKKDKGVLSTSTG